MKNRKRGFTLIELAIVIVIAGILAAVAIPIYQGFVDDAKWSEAESALGAIKTSADTYLSQYGKTALNTIDIAAAVIATSGPEWATLKFDTDSFKDMAYWDTRAFSFDSNGDTGDYTIICNTTNLSTAGNPPSEPGGITVLINGDGATWFRMGSSQ